MTRKCKAPAAPPQPFEVRRNNIISATTPEEARRKCAESTVSPELAAARAISATEGRTGMGEMLDMPELVACLRDQAKAVNGGDLAHAESMLMNQAAALQSLFARLTERGMGAEYLPQFEAFMRMALRAQAQCRATIETLAALKNPPVIFARQANISAGPQQVNNGALRAHAHAGEIPFEQSKLLEAQHGERLDVGAAAAAGGANPELATVGAIDRAKDYRR